MDKVGGLPPSIPLPLHLLVAPTPACLLSSSCSFLSLLTNQYMQIVVRKDDSAQVVCSRFISQGLTPSQSSQAIITFINLFKIYSYSTFLPINVRAPRKNCHGSSVVLYNLCSLPALSDMQHVNLSFFLLLLVLVHLLTYLNFPEQEINTQNSLIRNNASLSNDSEYAFRINKLPKDNFKIYKTSKVLQSLQNIQTI